MTIKLIVGLRNPGMAYERTRHNAGGWFVEELVKSNHAAFKVDKKLQGELADLTIENRALRALLPLSFMNHSGLSVHLTSQFYRIEPHEILVVHDDLDLPVGTVKLKIDGGHGGHNGLRDIISQLGTRHFYRLRLGIAHPSDKTAVVDYVLGKPSAEDKQLINDAISRALVVLPLIIQGQIEKAMTTLHS